MKESKILICKMCNIKTLHFKISDNENFYKCYKCDTIKEKRNGRGKIHETYNPEITTHIKISKESEYTLCGRRIFSINKKGIRILLANENLNIKALHICGLCDKIRLKLNPTVYD